MDEKYDVYYDDVLIGLYIRNKSYTTYKAGLDELKFRGIDVLPIVAKFEDRTIPFFERRIKNCSRFEGHKIGYHTDPVELIKR